MPTYYTKPSDREMMLALPKHPKPTIIRPAFCKRGHPKEDSPYWNVRGYRVRVCLECRRLSKIKNNTGATAVENIVAAYRT